MTKQTKFSTILRTPTPNAPAWLHPNDALADTTVDREEKRALLAAWASDAHAVQGSPALRQLPSGAVVAVDDILAALKRLDAPPRPAPRRPALSPRHRRLLMGEAIRVRGRRRDDDDGPPSAPASAPRPVAPVSDGGQAELAFSSAAA